MKHKNHTNSSFLGFEIEGDKIRGKRRVALSATAAARKKGSVGVTQRCLILSACVAYARAGGLRAACTPTGYIGQKD